MKNSGLSNLKIILSGLVIVTIPVTIIILLTIYTLTTYTNFRFTESGIIGAAVAWVYWEFAALFWIKWSLKRGVEKNRLHKIGIWTLVLWPSDLKKIEKIELELQKK